MRVAIVNDLSLAVQVLKKTLENQPGVEIAWVAEDGKQAVEKCKADTPDAVLMDLIMPIMDGVEATRQIMLECPCAILVVTATVEGNADKVFRAMGHGALDAVATPVLGPGGSVTGGAELLDKLRTIATVIGKNLAPPKPDAPILPTPANGRRPPLAAIGSSTGGPSALAVVLSALPANYAAGVVIVQHVDGRFTQGLAEWLDAQTAIKVRLAQAGDRATPGVALIAGGDRHLTMASDHSLVYTSIPMDTPYKPSVDVFFKSLADAAYPPSVAVLLTGMGKDGAKGMAALKQKKWRTIAQDEASSVVWGMPRAAVELGAAGSILPLKDIGQTLADMY